MDGLRELVDRTIKGDLDAFGKIISRFQDMALAYAFSVIGNFQSAEDAVQEAFIQAYRDLGALREPEAFPGWLRKVVFKHCDRIKRRKFIETVPLEAVAESSSPDTEPVSIIEKRELREAVLRAIVTLPENERTVTTLFYINGYTQRDIADFLELPVTTINNRLHSSRKRLKERMVQMVDKELKSYALPKQFPERIRILLEFPRPLEIEHHPVNDLWQVFRSCFPDSEEIELDEICRYDKSLLDGSVLQQYVCSVDEEHYLRPELTSQMVDYWLKKGGVCSVITAGRVFRPGHTETETLLEVHHQAEVLWVAERLDINQCNDTMCHVASRLMPGVEFKPGEYTHYSFVLDPRTYVACWNDKWISVAGGGVAQDEWLEKARLDPSKYGAISFAFGLERCALANGVVDDIRKLWHPPYV